MADVYKLLRVHDVQVWADLSGCSRMSERVGFGLPVSRTVLTLDVIDEGGVFGEYIHRGIRNVCYLDPDFIQQLCVNGAIVWQNPRLIDGAAEQRYAGRGNLEAEIADVDGVEGYVGRLSHAYWYENHARKKPLRIDDVPYATIRLFKTQVRMTGRLPNVTIVLEQENRNLTLDPNFVQEIRVKHIPVFGPNARSLMAGERTFNFRDSGFVEIDLGNCQGVEAYLASVYDAPFSKVKSTQ